MFWMVVQTDLVAPTAEQLVEAFEAVPSLVAMDARRTARYSFGILAENLPTDEAGDLVAALTRLGIPSAAINPADLPELPPPQRYRQLLTTEDSLTLVDTMQRSVSIGWDHLELIAVGDISTIGQRIVADVQRVSHGKYDHLQVVPSTVEITQSRVVMEIIADGHTQRFQLDEEFMLFANLTGRRLIHRRGNFIQSVVDVLNHAPRAAVNRGAAALSGKPGRIQPYANQVMFDRENRWLLWWSKQAH